MSTFELDEPATVCSTLNSYYIQHGLGPEWEIALVVRQEWRKYKAGRSISPRKVSSNDHYSACVLQNW